MKHEIRLDWSATKSRSLSLYVPLLPSLPAYHPLSFTSTLINIIYFIVPLSLPVGASFFWLKSFYFSWPRVGLALCKLARAAARLLTSRREIIYQLTRIN